MKLELHPDRLFPAEPRTRAIARELYAQVAELPIISPHGHTDPSWFASDAPLRSLREDDLDACSVQHGHIALAHALVGNDDINIR